MDFSQKVVLITGASRGIGRATAQQFAREGASVAVHYHQDRLAADQTLASLAVGRHITVQADIADPTACQTLIETVVRALGRIDILVNNAGIYDRHHVAEVNYQQWQDGWVRTLGTNLFGPANVSYCTVRYMIKQGGGRIVNVSSRGAFRGEPEAPAYGASKAGLNAMSQSMAMMLAPYNIFVYVLAPGWVETDMAAPYLTGAEGEAIRNQSPLKRVAQPEEIARVILFLASEGNEYLTGCIVDANGASYLRT